MIKDTAALRCRVANPRVRRVVLRDRHGSRRCLATGGLASGALELEPVVCSAEPIACMRPVMAWATTGLGGRCAAARCTETAQRHPHVQTPNRSFWASPHGRRV